MTTISYLTSVLFSDGAAKNLDAELAAANLRRPLLVADKGIVQAGVFDAVTAPVRAKIGGGSPIDLGKAVALASHHDGPLESYVAINGGVARIGGAARAWNWIVRATENASDAKARWHMMMAALQGGLTFQKGLGAVHALSHAVGALREPSLHHGMLNGVLLPHILQFSEQHAAEKFAVLRSVLGLKPETDLAQAVHDLLERLRLPTTLTQMGFDRKHIPIAVTRALDDHSNATAALRPDARQYGQLLTAAI